MIVDLELPSHRRSTGAETGARAALQTGQISAEELREAGAGLRAATWACQHGLGVTHVPSNDFSFYDHVLDTVVMVGAIPERYGGRGRSAWTPTSRSRVAQRICRPWR